MVSLLPDHSGIFGNELAGRRDRNRSNTPLMDLRQLLGSQIVLLEVLFYIFRKFLNCHNIQGQRQTKLLVVVSNWALRS